VRCLRCSNRFLRERRYLKNVTPKPPRGISRPSWRSHARCRADLNKSLLQDVIVGLRERGLSPVSCNTYLKALNAFFAWLHAEGHLQAPPSISTQRTEQRVIQIVSNEQLQRLLAFKPKRIATWRADVLACTVPRCLIR
jgi:site-specific recombinase XerD